MFRKNLMPVWVGILMLSSIYLMGQESWTPPQFNIVGDWDMDYDFNCDGFDGTTTWSIYGDGTFLDPLDSYTGTWALAGNQIDLYYDDPPFFHYTGTIINNIMNGTMSDSVGTTGCWDAQKL
jgi:hypothetical protein